MAIVDSSGKVTKIATNDTMVFNKESETILFSRGTKLYFSVPPLEHDKVLAKFINSLNDFTLFAHFIGEILGLSGEKRECGNKYFFWYFTRNTGESFLKISAGDIVIFDKERNSITIKSSKNEEFFFFKPSYIKTEYHFDDLLILLGYFYDLTHVIFNDKENNTNTFSRVFV